MSIFDLEKRIDVNHEINSLHEFILSNKISFKSEGNYYYKHDLFQIIDRFFIHWPNRGTAFDKDDYFAKFDLFYSDYEVINRIGQGLAINNTENLYYLEFLINMIIFLINIPKNKERLFRFEDDNITSGLIVAIITNFELILEHMNYQIIDKDDVRILVKRDENLDAALYTLDPNEDKDLALMLLEYLDFKNKDNIREKTVIIAHMYKYFEQLKHNAMPKIIFKSSDENKNIDLLKDFNFICNEFDMRHWPKNIKRNTGTTTINDEDMLDTLDLAYYLGLQIMNSNRIVQSNTKVEDFKVKYGFKDNGKLSK